MGYGQPTMAMTVPPIQFDYIVETEIGNQIEHMMGHDDRGRDTLQLYSLLHDGAQGRTMQVVEMRVRHEYKINWRQVANLYSRLTQPLQNE